MKAMSEAVLGKMILGWVSILAGFCFLALIGTGCMEDGKDGAAGPQGPAGDAGPAGENYVSYTNPANGQVTTVAVDSGDNSPVEIVINVNSGADGQCGTRRENPPAEEAPAAP